MLKVKTLIACVVMVLMSSSAFAASIGLNFVGGRSGGGGQGTGGTDGSSLLAGEVAGVNPQANWNNAFGSNGGPLALMDDSGAASGASVSWGGVPNSWTVNGGVQTTPDAKLMNGYVDTNTSSTTTVSFSGIGYDLYDVVLYYDGDGNGRSGTYSVNGNVLSPAVDSSNFPNNGTIGNYDDASADLDGNYLLYLDQSGDLTVTAQASNFRGPLNGIQIIDRSANVPEPATMGLLGIAGVAFLRRRRTA